MDQKQEVFLKVLKNKADFVIKYYSEGSEIVAKELRRLYMKELDNWHSSEAFKELMSVTAIEKYGKLSEHFRAKQLMLIEKAKGDNKKDLISPKTSDMTVELLSDGFDLSQEEWSELDKTSESIANNHSTLIGDSDPVQTTASVSPDVEKNGEENDSKKHRVKENN
ncbi:uncharacterized protein LOC116169331 [Photinus pyralis]|nr:uncharacterized protein LOC116169331 [Photinus pyralis]